MQDFQMKDALSRGLHLFPGFTVVAVCFLLFKDLFLLRHPPQPQWICVCVCWDGGSLIWRAGGARVSMDNAIDGAAPFYIISSENGGSRKSFHIHKTCVRDLIPLESIHTLWIRMSSTVCVTVCRLEHLGWEAEALKVFMPGWIFFEFSRVQLTSGAGAFYHNRSLMCFDCPVWPQLLNPWRAWGLAQPLHWSKSILLSVFLIQAIRSVCKSVSWVPFCSFFFFPVTS